MDNVEKEKEINVVKDEGIQKQLETIASLLTGITNAHAKLTSDNAMLMKKVDDMETNMLTNMVEKDKKEDPVVEASKEVDPVVEISPDAFLDDLPIFPEDRTEFESIDNVIDRISSRTNTAQIRYSRNSSPVGVCNTLIGSYQEYAKKEDLESYNALKSAGLDKNKGLLAPLKALQKTILKQIVDNVDKVYSSKMATSVSNTSNTAFRPLVSEEKKGIGRVIKLHNFNEEIKQIASIHNAEIK